MFYINYGDKEYLGDEIRAENMVLWSRRQTIDGKTVSKVLDCGLTVRLVADDSEPKLYLFWSQNKFNKFCEVFGNPESILLKHYGLQISRIEGNTYIKILDASEEGTGIFAFEGSGNCSLLVLGMICLTESGPYFFTETECQTDITDLRIQVTAQKIKPVTLGDKLAGKENLDVSERLLIALNNLGYSSKRTV